MRFSRSTLDVVLYQVLLLSQQLRWGSVCNVVVYEVLQVSEQVSVFLWSYHQRRYKMFCVCYYQSVQVVRACALWTSCLVQRLKKIIEYYFQKSLHAYW